MGIGFKKSISVDHYLQYLIICCDIIDVFAVTFDQFNVSLQNKILKSINFEIIMFITILRYSILMY